MRGFSDEITPHHVVFEAYGVRLRVGATSAELLGRVEQLLPPMHERLQDSSEAHRVGIVEEDDGSYSVYNGAYRASERGGRDLALVALDDQIRAHVALWAPDFIFLHAGAIAHNDKVIIFPGDSFSGKSTLIAALVQRGATYYSDEFAVIDASGRVHPYAKPLSLRQLWVTGEAWSGDRTAESLGGTSGVEPLPLGFAVITYFVPGAEWRPRQLYGGEAALALFSKAAAARLRPQDCLRILGAAVEDATVLEGERGEADEFAELLLDGALV